MQGEAVAQKKEEVRRKLRERRVPSSPFGRVMGFAQLGASLVYGTISDSVSQYFAPKSAEQDPQKPANRCAAPPFSQPAGRCADTLWRDLVEPTCQLMQLWVVLGTPRFWKHQAKVG